MPRWHLGARLAFSIDLSALKNINNVPRRWGQASFSAKESKFVFSARRASCRSYPDVPNDVSQPRERINLKEKEEKKIQ